MAHPYQCSHNGCRKWVTLAKPIEQYRRSKRCPACGRDSLKPRRETERAKNKRRVCLCDGWGFPHRKGSAPWCRYSARLPTSDELRERYGYGL